MTHRSRVFVALCLCALSACGGKADSTPVIGLITKTESNPFFVTMKAGAEAAATANGFKLLTGAGKNDGDNASQVTAIENMIAAGAKTVLITVNDSKAIVPAIVKARAQGVMVVALDSPADPADATDGLFATDNYRAGELIGQYARAMLDAKRAPRIATLDLLPGHPVGAQRHNGFLKGFGLTTNEKASNELAQPAEVVCMADSFGDRAKGQTAMENCLQKNPDINVVYTINEPTAAGAYNALERAGKANSVVLVSVDGGCQGIKAIKDGRLGATAQQYPDRMARLGVDAAVAFARTATKPSGYTDTGVQLITAQSVAGVPSIGADSALTVCWGDRWRARALVATLGPFIALLLACVVFSTQSPRFLASENFALILQQVMVVGVLAIGQTLVILTAGIDLSCGLVMALGGMVMTKLAVVNGWPPVAAVTAGIALTTAVGMLNGLLVTRAKLPPFIVTLGTMNIAFAATQLVSRSQSIADLPSLLTWLGHSVRLGATPVSYGVILMLLLYVVAWVWLRETAAGRHVYAVGNHREAARLAGIHTERVLWGVYAAAGACYGIAALLSVARTGVGDPQAGQTENLDTVTAVVLGGTSLFGGRGIVLGTLVGALIVGVFRNGLTLMGVSSIYQVLVTGVLVIVAVALDQWSREA